MQYTIWFIFITFSNAIILHRAGEHLLKVAHIQGAEKLILKFTETKHKIMEIQFNASEKPLRQASRSEHWRVFFAAYTSWGMNKRK